jgi:hypothetical protein
MTALAPEKVPFWPWGLVLFVVGLYVLGVAALIAGGRREDARALAGFIPDCRVLVGRLARDARISRPRRLLLGLALRVVVRGGGLELVRAAWPGPQASLTLVLRAAGLETNGAATPPTTL